MKLSLRKGECEDSSGDCTSFPENYFEKIESVLEKELLKIYPDSKNFESVEISISFVSPEKIRELNKLYRDVDESTDVLSFPLLDENIPVEVPELPVLALGDIVICPPEVLRLHSELNESEGILLMIAHSFLHLLGYDHDTQEKQDDMWAKQEAIKNSLLKKFQEAE